MSTASDSVSGVLYTCDMRLAAAMSVFVAPMEGKPIEKVRGPDDAKAKAFYYFPSCDLASALMAAWEAKADGDLGPCSDRFPGDHPLRNVEHPFWYVRCALRHRERYLDATLSCRTLNIVRRGGRIYLVTV